LRRREILTRRRKKGFFFFFNPDETWSKSLSYFSSVFSLSPTGRRLRSFLVRFSSLFAHQVAHSSSYSGPFAGNVRPNKMEDGKQRVPTAFAGFNFFFQFSSLSKVLWDGASCVLIFILLRSEGVLKRQTIDWWPFGLAWLWSNSWFFPRK